MFCLLDKVSLLVSPLGSPTIVKFNSVSVHCFLELFFSFVRVLLQNFLSVYYCTRAIYYNFTEIYTVAGTAAHAQAVIILLLGTKLVSLTHPPTHTHTMDGA